MLTLSDEALEKKLSSDTGLSEAPELASLFSHGAVLQRDCLIPVWGKALPMTQILVELNSCKAMTVSAPDGNFMVYLPPQKFGGPYQLKVSCLRNGATQIVNDVYVGEVYLTSGQSNMEFRLKYVPEFKILSEKGELDDDLLRFRQIPVSTYPVRRTMIGGSWKKSTAGNSGNFSAVAYLFAKNLRRKLNMAVGVINASYGGTAAEVWISREGLLNNPDWRQRVLENDKKFYSANWYANLPENRLMPDLSASIMADLAAKFPQVLPNKGEEKGFHTDKFNDKSWREMLLPDCWTVAGHNHPGIFWFRKSVEIPADWRGESLDLSLGAIDKGDITYFNGVEVGRIGDGIDLSTWNTKRCYKIPEKLIRFGQKNYIAVRVSSMVSICFDGGFLGPDSAMYLGSDTRKIPLDGVWRYEIEEEHPHIWERNMANAGPGAIQGMHVLFDNIIYPLIPYALRGVIYYQGEANAIWGASEYRELLTSLINDWRYRWGQQKLDFFIIQLPGFQAKRIFSPHSTWAQIRQAQSEVCRKFDLLPVVCYDTGDAVDIHPPQKAPIAERLADLAFSAAENREPRFSPYLKNIVRLSKTKIKLSFEVGTSKLQWKSATQNGFAMLDENNQPVLLKAQILDSDTVTLTIPRNKKPKSIFFAWSNFPDADLENNFHFPVEPFRFEL